MYFIPKCFGQFRAQIELPNLPETAHSARSVHYIRLSHGKRNGQVRVSALPGLSPGILIYFVLPGPAWILPGPARFFLFFILLSRMGEQWSI